MTIRAYREKLAAIEAGLPPGDQTLMSLEDRMRGRVGGRLVQVTRQVAARLIEDNSHRLATAEEAEAFQDEQRRRREAARAERMTPKMHFLGDRVVLPPKAEEPRRKASR